MTEAAGATTAWLDRLRARLALDSIRWVSLEPVSSEPERGPERTRARLTVAARDSLTVLRLLQEAPELGLRRLVDLSAIDRQGAPESASAPARFEVVYSLHAPTSHERLRVHVLLPDEERADEAPQVDSVVSIWPAASWLEREVFDLFGIVFRGHPDLRRILLEPGFAGAPLRKEAREEGRKEARREGPGEAPGKARPNGEPLPAASTAREQA